MPTGDPRPLFQRRHYEALADVIRRLGSVTEFQRRNIATEFAYLIGSTNARFNRDRFIGAATDTDREDRHEYVPPVVPAPTPVVPAPVTTPDREAHMCGLCANAGRHTVATHICSREGRSTRRYTCPDHYLGCCRPIEAPPPIEAIPPTPGPTLSEWLELLPVDEGNN